MKIEINDYTNDSFKMNKEEGMLELYPWIVLNLDEIGIEIAMNLLYAEYKITQEILDEEINDYLSHIHERILEKTIQKIEENGKEVL